MSLGAATTQRAYKEPIVFDGEELIIRDTKEPIISDMMPPTYLQTAALAMLIGWKAVAVMEPTKKTAFGRNKN